MSRSPRITSRNKQSIDDYLSAWQATTKLLREGHSFSGNEPNCAFLNCRAGGFANVSAVTGLDFSDDGRALGVTDWDQDGDLDIWLFSRTGPRLRLMRNETVAEEAREQPNFVAFRLQGTASNRDGIGARIEVELAGRSAKQPLIQSLYAGDAFLSQSSKWIHFGLGSEMGIEAATVRWPNGSRERFANLKAGNRYRLVEGTGTAVIVKPRVGPLALRPGVQKTLPPSPISRTLLATRLPAPILRYQSFTGKAKATVETKDQPLLVVLWASWCPNCVAELRSLTVSQSEVKRTGLNVLALSVDELDQANAATGEEARAFLARTGFPFPAGMASREMLDKLDLVKRIVFPGATDFAIPSSFLLDAEGWIAGIYTGAVETSRLLEDVNTVQQAPGMNDRRNIAIPMAGRWSNPPRQLLLRAVARTFRDKGFTEDHARYLQLDADFLQQQRQSTGSPAQRRQLEQQYGAANFNLAVHLRSAGKIEEAMEHLRLAVEADPEHADALINLGALSAEADQADAAIDYLERAVTLKAHSIPARMNLALALSSKQRFQQAIPHYENVISLEPSTPNAYSRLARAQLEIGMIPAAVQSLEKAIEIKATDFPVNVSLAWIRATSVDDSLRDGEQAVKIAQKLNKITGGKDMIVADLLAAAHAELGDFSEAKNVLQRFLDRAGTRNARLTNLFEARQRQYNSSKPHRDPDGKYP